MSVARAREINARLRAAGITVHEWAGWESRGNGQSSAYEGCIVHHTATAYGMAPAILVNGRSDLAGPLCNYAGNADGSVTVIAANPANHAGASGGRSMGPLPVTTLFNKRVMGLEIVYPGDQPMTAAQYRTAAIWARIVTDVLGYGDIQRARAHAETSVTGKWDPGYAPGRTIDTNAFRAAAASGQLPVEDDVSWTENLTFTAPDGKVTTIQARDWVMWTNYAAWRAVAVAEANGAAIAALANDQDITPEAMRTVVNDAIAKQAPAMAAMVTGSIKDDLSAMFLDVVGQDNADQAEQMAQRTVALISTKLAAVSPTQEGNPA